MMKSASLYVSSYCLIRDRSILLDGKQLFNDDQSASDTDFLKSVYKILALDYAKFHKMDTLCKAVFLAAELITTKSALSGTNTALVFSNHSSSYISDKKHASLIYSEQDNAASPSVFVYTLPNIAMGELSIRHQLHSEQVFFIFDKFTPGFLVPYNERILQEKKADQVLSGWVEAGEKGCDIFLYLLQTKGNIPHTLVNIENLYNNKHE